MLSYQNWKLLNESFGSPINLGVKSKSSIGTIGSLLRDLENHEEALSLEEAKKKMGKVMAKHMKKMGKKKKMLLDDEDEVSDAVDDVDVDVEDDDDDDDGDEEKGCAGKFCGKMSKKKMKKMKKSKKMGADMDMDDDMGMPMKKKKPVIDDMDDEMEDDDEEMDMDDEDLEDEEEETGEDLDGDNEEDEDEDHAAMVNRPMMSKKKSRKNMKKEDADWWASLKRQIAHPQIKYDDGWSRYQEDSLLPPTDPNAEVAQKEPGPGDVGYAPQGRIGGF